jgi:hypothetical protein
MDATLPLNSSDKRIGLGSTAANSTAAGEDGFFSVARLHPERATAKVTAHMHASRKCLDGVRRTTKLDSIKGLAVSWAIPEDMAIVIWVPCCVAFDWLIACLLVKTNLYYIQVDTCVAINDASIY